MNYKIYHIHKCLFIYYKYSNFGGKSLDILKVKELVENNYNLHIEYIQKIKNVYKISNDYNNFCLKVINYDFGHFLFIISAIKYLKKNDFKNTPEILNTQCGQEYIQLEDKFAYLTPWVDSRVADYDNSLDVLLAASKLAELHNKSLGFKLTEDMNPRIGWFKWIETFNTRENEILDFKGRILKKDKKTKFDVMYLDKMDEEIEFCKSSKKNLSESNYLEKMKIEIVKNGFCHHDYANHNVLITGDGNVNVIDFDYCILDTHLHDLSSLLLRIMKHGKWNMNIALFILDAYDSINRVMKDDIPIMAGFMEFPQDYWQIGIQYYWEKHRWPEDAFIKKLKKIYYDEEEKQNFIDDFRIKKYS